jgi:hypothetical protein
MNILVEVQIVFYDIIIDGICSLKCSNDEYFVGENGICNPKENYDRTAIISIGNSFRCGYTCIYDPI